MNSANEVVRILDVSVCNRTLEEMVDFADATIQSRELRFGTGINLNQLYLIRHNQDFCNAVKYATLLVPDGTPLLWIAKWMGTPFREKVCGADFTLELFKLAVRKNYRIYILGGKPNSAEEAIRNIEVKYGKLNVAGYYCPPMNYQNDPTEVQSIVERLKQSSADILLMAMSAPHQEIFVQKYFKEFHIPIVFGAGIAIDYNANKVKQAPYWVNKIGMEWLYRMVQEPSRLFKRYIIHDLPFLAYMWIWAYKQKYSQRDLERTR